MQVITHPDNVAAIRKAIPQVRGMQTFGGCEIVESNLCEKTRKTGKYILPSGDAVELKDLSIVHRFWSYGPEDIDYLLYAEIVTEQIEPVFYMLDQAWSIPLIPQIINKMDDISRKMQFRMESAFSMAAMPWMCVARYSV